MCSSHFINVNSVQHYRKQPPTEVSRHHVFGDNRATGPYSIIQSAKKSLKKLNLITSDISSIKKKKIYKILHLKSTLTWYVLGTRN